MSKLKLRRESKKSLLISSDNESESSINEESPRSANAKRKSLDSNGESEDEIEKLQNVVDKTSKELLKERQNNSKLKTTVKLLKRELRKLKSDLQDEREKQRNSDSEGPPWEKRKVELQIQELLKLQEQKNKHIEQLLEDCRVHEGEKRELEHVIKDLTQKLSHSVEQFDSLTEEYAITQKKLSLTEESIAELQQQNSTLQLQMLELQEIRLQHERNLEQISEAVDATVDKCKEIIANKDSTIQELQFKLSQYSEPGEVQVNYSSSLHQEIAEKNTEIENLKAQIVEASKEMEKSAKIFEEFKSTKTRDSPEITVMKMNKKMRKILRDKEKLQSNLEEMEKNLCEKDKEICDLSGQLQKFQNGELGLREVIEELNETKIKLENREKRIEDLVPQLNALEIAADNLHFENNELRERLNLSPTDDLGLGTKRTTLRYQLKLAEVETAKYRDKAIQLGIENQNYKRQLRLENPKIPEDSGNPQVSVEDYQKACSEAILLRKGLMEILQSIREHDGNSDVKLESPVLEKLVTVLNSEKLWGHYDAYSDLMAQLHSTEGENKILRERIREIREELKQFQDLVQTNGTLFLEPKRSSEDRNTQDAAVDPVPFYLSPSEDGPEVNREDLVQVYETKLRDLELKLVKVKVELESAIQNCTEEKLQWTTTLQEKENAIRELQQQVSVYQRSLHQQEEFLERVKDEFSFISQDGNNSSVSAIEAEQTKQLMEKAIAVLKARLHNQELACRRYEQLLEEARRESLAAVEEHSAEILRLQDTVMEQQRALHRVELTQREMAASEAVNRIAARHLEEEVTAAQQRHDQMVRLQQQLQAAQSQLNQWKQAAENLMREKNIVKESLESEYSLVMEQLKRDLESSQSECKDLEDQLLKLRKELLQEKQEKQRNKLLNALVSKLKSELDKKEHQMNALKSIAEDLHRKMNQPMQQQPVSIIEDNQSIKNEDLTNVMNRIADLEAEKSDLNRIYEETLAQAKSLQQELESLRRDEDRKSSQISKLSTEKRELNRQLAILRTRFTKLNAEQTGIQTASTDVCQLLKRIKELESQLAVFHTAEKPIEDVQQSKATNLEQWKEKKRLQTSNETLKRKLKQLEQELEQTKTVLETARRNVTKLSSEKRTLEDKIKQRGEDMEKLQRVVQENTQFQQRIEALERRLTDTSKEEVNSDRHKLQISVLQDRIKKQEEKIAQLELENRSGKTSGTAKSALEKLHQENVAFKIKQEQFKIITPKIKDTLNRLITLVQNYGRSSANENKTKNGEGSFLMDLRRTLNTLQQLMDKLLNPSTESQ